MANKWLQNMCVDRFALYQRASEAFDSYKPGSFLKTLGDTMRDPKAVADLFGIDDDAQAIEGEVSVLTASQYPQLVRHAQESVRQAVAELANALIDQQIGTVGAQLPRLGERPVCDQQRALDRIFGFSTNAEDSIDGISAEAIAIKSAMTLAIVQDIQRQKASTDLMITH